MFSGGGTSAVLASCGGSNDQDKPNHFCGRGLSLPKSRNMAGMPKPAINRSKHLPLLIKTLLAINTFLLTPDRAWLKQLV